MRVFEAFLQLWVYFAMIECVGANGEFQGGGDVCDSVDSRPTFRTFVVVGFQELIETGGVESVHAMEARAVGHFVTDIGIKQGVQAYRAYFVDEFVFV